ncbi:MAG: hypothetical protein IJ552_07520 [Prevotella sp.]|nr:hypothetical protein [Prevotella sp.]
MGVSQKWWDRHKHASSDPESKDGIRHFTDEEIEDYKSKVIEALNKREIKKEDAEKLWYKYSSNLDEVIANDSPEDFAELIACDYDGNKKLSEIVPAFISEKSTKQIQNESEDELEQIKKEAAEQAKIQSEAEEWVNFQ